VSSKVPFLSSFLALLHRKCAGVGGCVYAGGKEWEEGDEGRYSG